MAKDPLLPDVPGEGDSWESLASNLLGINLNKPLDAEIVSPEELEALEIDVDEVPARPASTSGPELPVEIAGDVESPAGSTPADALPLSSTLQPGRESDPYWDPLAEWDWDEEPSSKRAAAPKAVVREAPAEPVKGRELPAVAALDEESVVKGPGTDARRAADSFDTVSDYRDEYESETDWEFGAGLLEGVAPPPPKPTRPASAEPTPRATPPEFRAEPRERDRRGGPAESTPRERAEPREKRAETPVAARRPVEPREPREKPEPAAPPKQPPRPTAPVPSWDDAEAFGAGLMDVELETPSAVTGAGSETPEERGRRRRGRRGSRPSRDDREHAATLPVSSAVTEADLDEEDEASEDAQADSPYHNIPSWEEAISYLINPKRGSEPVGESRSSEAREAASPSDRGGSGRSSGGRRRRRRPPQGERAGQ